MCIHYTHVDLFILIHNISFTKVFSMCSPTHSHNIQVFPMCSPTHSHYNIHSQPHSMTVRDRMKGWVASSEPTVVVAVRLPWSQGGCGAALRSQGGCGAALHYCTTHTALLHHTHRTAAPHTTTQTFSKDDF